MDDSNHLSMAVDQHLTPLNFGDSEQVEAVSVSPPQHKYYVYNHHSIVPFKFAELYGYPLVLSPILAA
jgi:hypothetical protein